MHKCIWLVVVNWWMVNNYCLLYTYSYKQHSKTHAWWSVAGKNSGWLDWHLDWWALGLMQWLQLSSVKPAQALLFSPLQLQCLKYPHLFCCFRRTTKLIFTSCSIWYTEMAKMNRTLDKSDNMDQFYSRTLFHTFLYQSGLIFFCEETWLCDNDS